MGWNLMQALDCAHVGMRNPGLKGFWDTTKGTCAPLNMFGGLKTPLRMECFFR